MQANPLMLDATMPPRGASSPGAEMLQLVRDLYPICRSITGDGVRQTLARLAQAIPMQIHEVASGTPVLDWDVPREWNIRDAWIKNAAGDRVVDFQVHNLHVVNYSAPIRARVPLQELRRHLHTLPDHPDWIPYRTSYYTEDWGFCVTHRQYEALTEPEYDVCIDSELRDGSLTYGECLLPGRTDAEVLISAHVCHPSLANDNLSGIAVATALARHLASKRLRYSYRFLFAPGTIGAITWLATHEQQASAIAHGLVLAGVGGPGPITYKRSRRGDAAIDKAMVHVLGQAGRPHAVQDFSPFGHDERQYCSPGFDLPVGCLMRSPWGTYPEYHTSADSIDFVTGESLEESLEACIALVGVIEGNAVYVNRKPKGEVQLGRRGLYSGMGGTAESQQAQLAMLWVLNLCDGRHTLLDIAERANMPFALVRRAANALHAARLLSHRPAAQDRGARLPRRLRAHAHEVN
jgi:aminopeptidase-like protein